MLHAHKISMCAGHTAHIEAIVHFLPHSDQHVAVFHFFLSKGTPLSETTNLSLSLSLSLCPTALQPGVGLGLLQEFPPSFPVQADYCPISTPQLSYLFLHSIFPSQSRSPSGALSSRLTEEDSPGWIIIVLAYQMSCPFQSTQLAEFHNGILIIQLIEFLVSLIRHPPISLTGP
jgi:hypothetical protein